MEFSSSTVEASLAAEPARVAGDTGDVEYRAFLEESDLSIIMDLVDVELSEPYSIFTYRYFINQWPDLCYLVRLSFPPVRQQLSFPKYGFHQCALQGCLHTWSEFLNWLMVFS